MGQANRGLVGADARVDEREVDVTGDGVVQGQVAIGGGHGQGQPHHHLAGGRHHERRVDGQRALGLQVGPAVGAHKPGPVCIDKRHTHAGNARLLHLVHHKGVQGLPVHTFGLFAMVDGHISRQSRARWRATSRENGTQHKDGSKNTTIVQHGGGPAREAGCSNTAPVARCHPVGPGPVGKPAQLRPGSRRVYRCGGGRQQLPWIQT